MVFSWQFLVPSLVAAFSLLVALWAAFRGRSAHRHTGMERRLRDVEIGLVDALDALDKVTAIAKRKYARDSTRAARAAKKNGQEPAEETDDEWKARMNRELVSKRVGAN